MSAGGTSLTARIIIARGPVHLKPQAAGPPIAAPKIVLVDTTSEKST